MCSNTQFLPDSCEFASLLSLPTTILASTLEVRSRSRLLERTSLQAREESGCVLGRGSQSSPSFL